MAIDIKPVSSRQELKTFIYLPAKINSNWDNWMPPIYMEDKEFFNPKKNKSFSYSDTVLALAYRNGEAVGRIMGVINHRFNEMKNMKQGRFFVLETPDDKEVSHALISYIEQWNRDKGMDHIVGPFGFSDKDPQGLMVEGFDLPPVIATTSNQPYLQNLVESEGYVKDEDCLIYAYQLDQGLPPIYDLVERRYSTRPEFKIIEFNKKSELRPYIIPCLECVNKSFGDLYGFVPMDDLEMKGLAKKYMPVIDPRFVKVVAHNDQVIGFIIGMPTMTAGIQKAKGKLFPFGFIHILKASRNAKVQNTMLGGILPEYQHKGLEALMGYALWRSARKAGFTTIETHLTLENNLGTAGAMEKVNAKIVRRWRIYKKAL